MVLGDSVSGWSDVTSDVPQGSVLGPLLFTIFINDLPLEVRNKFLMYADDGKLITIIDPAELEDNSMQADINHIVNWCAKWSMELSPGKCKIMHFGKENQERKYYISLKDGNMFEVSKSSSERDIGILVEEDCRWAGQVSEAASKANRILGCIRNAFSY